MVVETQIDDYSNLTCTNLMIKLKILTKKLKSGDYIEFYSTREQLANIQKPFSKNRFKIQSNQINSNLFHIMIIHE
ncbi:MAG: hypothetical protein K9W44_18100 [Candidatus Lokiarchaeota archaeon]|nr:hypothetical protein [Candidatus Harpocratesius repetitus]